MSRNIPAVKAAYIIGDGSASQSSKEFAEWAALIIAARKKMPVVYGLSAAIGACGDKTDRISECLLNAGANGSQKDISSVIEVRTAKAKL